MRRTRFPVTTERLYSKYTNMITSAAHKFAATTGIPESDLQSLGHKLFMDAVDKWDSSRGSFSTILTIKLRTGFIDYMRRHDAPVSPDSVYIQEPVTDNTPMKVCAFKDLLYSLSKEAQEIVSILLDAPVETLGIIGTEPPKMIRGAIQRYLLKIGWCHATIWEAFRELKGVFR